MKKIALLPLLGICALLLISAKHSGPSYETRPRYRLDKYADEIAKKYNLQVLTTGLGTLADAKRAPWGISFVSNQNLTIEQGRILANALTAQLLSKIFEDPSFANYWKNRPSGELKREDLAFRLAFWDQQTNRPLYPYLAQIRLVEGALYFHYADPLTQSLQDPIVESLAKECI